MAAKPAKQATRRERGTGSLFFFQGRWHGQFRTRRVSGSTKAEAETKLKALVTEMREGNAASMEKRLDQGRPPTESKEKYLRRTLVLMTEMRDGSVVFAPVKLDMGANGIQFLPVKRTIKL